VQVDPIKPLVTPTGTKRLKLKCDALLSAAAFKFNLCRYIKFADVAGIGDAKIELAAGAYTRPLLSPI